MKQKDFFCRSRLDLIKSSQWSVNSWILYMFITIRFDPKAGSGWIWSWQEQIARKLQKRETKRWWSLTECQKKACFKLQMCSKEGAGRGSKELMIYPTYMSEPKIPVFYSEMELKPLNWYISLKRRIWGNHDIIHPLAS